MLLDGKSFDLDVFGFLTLQTSERPKSKLLACSQPDRWPQDVKIFEFEFFGLQNLEFEGFNILEPCLRMLIKIFDLEVHAPGIKKFRSKSSILRFGYRSDIAPGC